MQYYYELLWNSLLEWKVYVKFENVEVYLLLPVLHSVLHWVVFFITTLLFVFYIFAVMWAV